ncbi:MAG: ABC transporter substrate-binding protein [Eubacteriaceae bacterium]
MKKINKAVLVITILLLVFSLSACNTGTNSGDANTSLDTTYPLTITDDLGNEVTFDEAPEKIVSVAPSNTEMLFALGLGDKVVGRSEYCNYPEEVASIDTVGTYSAPNTELIIDLAPDVLFSHSSVPDDIKLLLEDAGIKVVIFNPANIDGVLNNINTVGKICDVQDTSQEVVSAMETKRQEIIEKIQGQESKKVFVDLGTLYSVGPGSFIDSILQELNVINIAGDAETQWPQLSAEKIVDENPQIYISTFTSLEDLQATDGFESIDAFKNDNVVIIPWGTPENDMIQRPSVRVIDGLEIYAKAIFPSAFE